MLVPPNRRAFRAASLAALVAAVLVLSACGVLAEVMPLGAPAGTPIPVATTTLPLTTSPTATPSSLTPTSLPSGLPTYAQPAEPACALPEGVPATIPGSGGPTLSAKRVEKAWRASESGRSYGVTAGKVDDHRAYAPRPGSAVAVAGAPKVSLNILEWSSLSTIVLADPGVAAAKLAAVRAMVDQPCSYPFAYTGPWVVARLTRDEPDLVVVSGIMDRIPVTDTFIRYGNTITHSWMTMVPPEADELRETVLDVLTKS